MTTLMMFFTVILILPISTTFAGGFFQSVEGNCKEIPKIESYDVHKLATGEWYYHYVSFGQEGDRCVTAHAVARGNKNYADLLVFDSKMNSYLNLPFDLTYHPEQPGIYSNDAPGAVTLVHGITFDISDSIFVIQCREVEGKTLVTALFGSRAPVMDGQAKGSYQEFTAKLKNLKLLPEMHRVPMTDCPPIKNVTYA